MLDGQVSVGNERATLVAGQVGWLRDADAGEAIPTDLRITGGSGGARFVLYAGERQGVPIVMHGPFVGETRADLVRLSKDYMEGKMPRISELGL
jgi:redox-sensitive bicupin YhaK (pirin superfamily)